MPIFTYYKASGLCPAALPAGSGLERDTILCPAGIVSPVVVAGCLQLTSQITVIVQMKLANWLMYLSFLITLPGGSITKTMA
jgi:hypothetical protein